MINIYICEDNIEQLNKIKEAVENTIIIENYDMKIIKQSKDPYEILDVVKKTKGTGIYFLDIDLNSDINGIQLAEEIRKYDPSGYIIFITTHGELSHLTFKYKVEALDYIIKDDFQEVSERVGECIRYIYNKYVTEPAEKEVFYIKSNDKIILMEYNKIIMFETAANAHKVILHGEQRQVEFYGSMKEVEKALDMRFFRSHKSFIINKDKIRDVDKKNRIITMNNGVQCLVSVRAVKHIKKLFENQVSKGF